jgi:predicted alpha-1,6-mannanase (GH76 family)
MINGDSLINDGLNAECRNNGGPTYTYNQGVIVGGLVSLGALTGNRGLIDRATTIARAAMMRLVDDGILHEPVDRLEIDGPLFKGIFVFHLARLARLLPPGEGRRVLRRFLTRNAAAVWRRSGRGTEPISARWEGPVGQDGAAAQAAGVALLESIEH